MKRARAAVAGLSQAALRRLERDVLRGARRLYATSAASRSELSEASGRADVGVLPIPVDLERFTPAADWPPSQPTLLFVGRADDPRKNVQLLLAAAQQLPDVQVVLAGAPPATALPPNVRAIGPVDQLGALMRQATLFVLPSLQEGFGIVIAEALASGVPVVTTPSGGPEELVERSGAGRVLQGFSADELVATVATLLCDQDELVRMRADGRAYVEREHSPERFRAQLAEALA
jgi:glycosyltransferase involved in cell wall biosynthesis